MPIDFSKISSSRNSNTELNPRDIFTALPNKQEGKFEYPRDVQTQVWDKWFSRRSENDLVVKMNTGSGETVVGLLILKSSLNENKGPAVYIVPDKYLTNQVCNEAKALGIETTEDPESPRFLSGKAILVANIYKLVNGQSKFGVGDKGVKITIGSLLIDDSHACLSTVEEQFLLKIPTSHLAYEKIYSYFREALHKQCEARALEIENGEPETCMQVPFWTWQKHVSEISEVIAQHKNEDEFKFTWPLIKENIELSRCVVAANEIEISPHCIPIHMLPSITNASRRIFMTATLVDDSILSSHFGVDKRFLENDAIIPETAGDIGDRMILLPQVINPEIEDSEIKKLCKKISKQHNVVVIVPSNNRAKYWSNEADLIIRKKNIADGVSQLQSQLVGLSILVNRYDGVDLPKDACRLLVIDGLPTVRRKIDQVSSTILMGSPSKIAQLIQTIEQGMGRGVRSNDDYCAVLLMGKSLTSKLYINNAINSFSPGTKAQLDLSEQIAEQLKGSEIEQVHEALMYCLSRNQDWVSRSKGAVASLSYAPKTDSYITAIKRRQAYDAARINNLSKATDELEEAVKSSTDNLLQSHLLSELAEYKNLYNQDEAQKILMAAAEKNSRVLKPLQGIAYNKLSPSDLSQAKRCSTYLNNSFDSSNQAIVKLNEILDSLVFQPNTANLFEQAYKELAMFLGFTSQRPESEYGRGPDVIWEMGSLKYLVVECKNGVVMGKADPSARQISKKDCNQLNGSGEWFISQYDYSCSFTPVIIHPYTNFDFAASPKEGTRVMDDEKLEELKSNILSFVKAICIENKRNDDKFIREKMIFHKFRAEEFCDSYTKKPTKCKKNN